MTPSRGLVARLLAAFALVLPAACGDDTAASIAVPPEGGSGGGGGTSAKGGSSAGGTTSAGGAAGAACEPLPKPAPTSQDYCYVSADLPANLLSFCSGYPGAVRIACADGKVFAYESWPATSPCAGEGTVQKNCATGPKNTPISPFTDPCPTIGGAAGAGGGESGGAAGSAGSAGAGGAPPGGALCTQLATTEPGNVSPGIDPDVFLRCVGLTLNNGSGLALTTYGSVTASIDGGVGKCCVKATTQEPAPPCTPQ